MWLTGQCWLLGGLSYPSCGFFHGLPQWLSGKKSTNQCRKWGLNPWAWTSPEGHLSISTTWQLTFSLFPRVKARRKLHGLLWTDLWSHTLPFLQYSISYKGQAYFMLERSTQGVNVIRWGSLGVIPINLFTLTGSNLFFVHQTYSLAPNLLTAPHNTE